MTGCGCMTGGKRRKTRRRSRRTKRKMSKHHRRRSSRHRRSRRRRRTRRRRGGSESVNSRLLRRQGIAPNPTTPLLTGGNREFAPSDNKVSGGYIKKKRGGLMRKSKSHMY